MKKIIIDFEFNGLYRFDFTPEITQAKIMTTDGKKAVCKNFKTKKRGFCRDFYGKIEGTEYFSAEAFKKMLLELGADFSSEFFGFSIETDRRLLAEYGIFLKNYTDIQEELRRSEKYEERMAYAGSSLELCYYLVTNEVITVNHNSINELDIIKVLYDESTKIDKNEYLTIYPFGENAGMPLDEYVQEYFRHAEGYYYHHDNLLSRSLLYYMNSID